MRSAAHFGCGCLGFNIYRLGTPTGRSAELEECGSFVAPACQPSRTYLRVPASTLINKFLYCGSPSSQATFGRGCLGFSIYCPCTPRGRSAELEVRRSWRCAAPSRAHLGCECLGVNIYRLGIPRNRSAELDPGAWDTCNMCTSTKLHVYVRVRMPEKLKCRRSARSRCARRKRIQRRLSS